MENQYYLLSYHPVHTEGAELKKTSNELLLEKNAPLSTPPIASEPASTSTLLAEENFAAESVSIFLKQHKWAHHPLSILLPTEDVAFRTLTLPFEDPKKIRQVLPFEIENELLEDLSEMHYCYSISSASKGQSEVLILLMNRSLLESLKQHCTDQELIIRNMDCSALALFRTTRPFADADGLQIYVGADEAFISTITSGNFRTAKIFPSQISNLVSLLQQHSELSPQSFFKKLLQYFASTNQASSKEAKYYQEIQGELQHLATQFTRYWRTHAGGSQFKVRFYGLFAPLFDWNQVIFHLKYQPISTKSEAQEEISSQELRQSFSSDQEQNHDEKFVDDEESESSPDFSAELPATRSLETDLVQTSSSPHPEQRNYWGVLGDLSNPLPSADGSGEIGLFYPELFEKHSLSFYAEGTTWRRILKRHPFALISSLVLLLCIGVGIFATNRLKHTVLQQELHSTTQQIQNELKRLLPESKEKKIKTRVALLQSNIEQHKNYLEMSKQFEKREYKNLELLRNLSQIFTDEIPFQVDRVEYGKDRFSISGTIDSYDSLQLLKAKLSGMEDFKNKRVVGNNRKSSEGIIFRISIE